MSRSGMARGDEVDWKSVQTAVQRIMGVSQAWDNALGWQPSDDETPDLEEPAARRPSLPPLGDLKSFRQD